MLEPLPAWHVPREWDWIDTPMKQRVAEGAAVVFRIDGKDAGLVASVDTTKDSGVLALWIEALGGRIGNAPHKNWLLLGAALTECESIARRFSCSEIRIELGQRRGWKERLLPKLGFVRLDLPTGACMTKGL